MQSREDADTLRAIALSIPEGEQTETLVRVAWRLENDAKHDEQNDQLQEIGAGAARQIAGMVAALECDYDRLEELRNKLSNTGQFKMSAATASGLLDAEELEELEDLQACAGECESEDDALKLVSEDPLSIQLSGTWDAGSVPVADKAIILLAWGGPAVRIVCELTTDMEPHRAWIEAQDWGTPWTEYNGDAISSEALLRYCSCFYFGEG